MTDLEKFLRFVLERTPPPLNVIEFKGGAGSIAHFMLSKMQHTIGAWRNHDPHPGKVEDPRYEGKPMHHPFWEAASFMTADVMVSVDSMKGLEPTVLENIAKALGGGEGLSYVYIQMLTDENEWGRVTGAMQRHGFKTFMGGCHKVEGKGTITWKGLVHVGQRSYPES